MIVYHQPNMPSNVLNFINEYIDFNDVMEGRSWSYIDLDDLCTLTRTLIPVRGPANPHRPNPIRNGIQTWSDRTTISDSGCRSERFFCRARKGGSIRSAATRGFVLVNAHLVSLLPRAPSPYLASLFTRSDRPEAALGSSPCPHTSSSVIFEAFPGTPHQKLAR